MTQLPGGPVILMGNVTGLSEGPHGIHIHEFGDLSKGCDSLGAHYNPTLSHHGGPADPYRHVGDLGNIVADGEGKAKISDSDHLISLTGPHSVVGRGLVIHAGKDDFGRGGDKESLRTGNSGGRVACGVVSWAQPPHLVGRPPADPQAPPTEPQAEQIEP
nr:superoxide dismutase 3 [Geocoris pallidipennis]